MDDSYSFDDSTSSESETFDLKEEHFNFSRSYQNKQIETLKFLRQTLKVNKSLKNRLVLVESELEKYQEFGPFNPLVQLAPLVDRATSVAHTFDFIDDSSSSLKDKLTEDKFCQIEIDELPENVNEKNHFIQQRSLTPQVKIVEKVIEKYIENPKVSTANKECQCEDIKEKDKISDLHKEIQKLKVNHENEVKNLNSIIQEKSRKCDELNEHLVNLQNTHDVLTEKFAESQRNVLKLADENQTIKSLKQKLDLSLVENEQLYQDLQSKENILEAKRKDIVQLENDYKNQTKILEEQKVVINNLIIENEKHLKEKHIICQQKIIDLMAECDKLNQNISNLDSENKKKDELISTLSKQVERYKIEQQNFNFKEFVSIKRELNSLKQEKERQFANKVTTPTTINSVPQPPLPPIKQSKKSLFNFFNDK